MFANKKFTKKNMPVFKDNYVIYDPDNEAEDFEPPGNKYIQATILNDDDVPPKQLICIDITEVPKEKDRKWQRHRLNCDPLGDVCLLPEDAIRLAKVINMLVGEIFNENNYRR